MEDEQAVWQTTTVTAPDIECDGCANAITRALSRVPGVTTVQVDIPAKTVTVQHDLAQAPLAAVTAALDKAGFPVSE